MALASFADTDLDQNGSYISLEIENGDFLNRYSERREQWLLKGKRQEGKGLNV